MKIEAALAKVGVEIISEEPLGEGTVRYMLRAGTSPEHVAAWRNAITEYLIHADTVSDNAWTADVSRAYFVVGGAKVKYAWRIIISGDVDLGSASLAGAITRSLMGGKELDSFPIVSKAVDGNAAEGRLRGAHPHGTGEAVVAKEFSY